jgi:hypothetical protein
MDGHPQILADVGESRFFNKFHRHTKGKNTARKIELAKSDLLYLFNPENAYYQKYLRGLSCALVHENFLKFISQTQMEDKDFLEAYFQAVGVSVGNLSATTKYWVEKTPGNEFFLGEISTWWRNAQFIHMVRDPRDVYASYITRDHKNNRKITSVDAFAFIWGKSIRLLQQYQTQMGADQYCYLKYEDLVNSPKSNMNRLVNFLQIENRESLLLPTKGNGGNVWGGNAASGDKNYQIHNTDSGKWKQVLSDEQAFDLESLLYKEMRWLGYELVYSEAKLSPRFVYLFNNFLREIRVRYVTPYIYGS